MYERKTTNSDLDFVKQKTWSDAQYHKRDDIFHTKEFGPFVIQPTRNAVEGLVSHLVDYVFID